mgnify:CR=1 FL=1
MPILLYRSNCRGELCSPELWFEGSGRAQLAPTGSPYLTKNIFKFMNTLNIQQKITQLSKELEEHNYRYYILSHPVVSDYQFDMMLKELQDLEEKHPEFASPNSPTKRVGGDITKEFNTVKHRYPMLSLSNSYSKEELIDYAMRAGAPLEVVENLQQLEDEEEVFESIEDIWPDYPTKEDFFFNEDEY